MKEYIDVLKKWKDFDGRARRREYWMFVLFMAIFAIVASIIDAILGTICVFVGIYYLAMLLPMIAVSIRRMHDIGKSGWWLFRNTWGFAVNNSLNCKSYFLIIFVMTSSLFFDK